MRRKNRLGPRAEGLDAAACVYTVLRVLLDSLSFTMRGTPLGRTYHWLIRERRACPPPNLDLLSDLASRIQAEPPQLPSHLPLPSCILGLRPQGRSRRVQARWQRRLLAWRLTEWIIAGLTFYTSGSPKSPAGLANRVGTYFVSSRQEVLCGQLFRQLVRVCRSPCRLPSEVGRGIANLDGLMHGLETAAALGRDLDLLVPSSLDVDIEHVAHRLPAHCGGCSPEQFLKGTPLATFVKQQDLVISTEPLRRDVPRPCYRVAESLEVPLRNLLFQIGYSAPVLEKHLDKYADGAPMLGGLFEVMDKPGKFRLIFDRRPCNLFEKRVKCRAIPMGWQCTRLIIRPHEGARGSGSDLDSYFNRLKNHESGLSRAGFGRVFDGKEIPEWNGIPGERYRQAIQVVAMGGGNSPSWAQEMHLEILSDNGIEVNDFLEYRKSLPTGKLLVGVVYDDFIVICIAPLGELHSSGGLDRELSEQALAAYTVAGIPTSEKKNFGFSRALPSGSVAQADTTFTFWGSEMKGVEGILSAPLEKRLLLCVIGLK
jgi:hypothetical protein